MKLAFLLIIFANHLTIKMEFLTVSNYKLLQPQLYKYITDTKMF